MSTGPVPLRDPTERVMFALRTIVRSLRLSAHAIDSAVQISSAQLFVLQQLADGPIASMKALAARTLTDQSSVSGVVAKLVAAGLVIRTTSPQDARRTELALSPKGKEVLARAPEPAQARLVAAVRLLSDGDRDVLAALLGRVAADMGAGDEPPTMFFEDDARRRSQTS